MSLFNNNDSQMLQKRISELESSVELLEKENAEHRDTIESFPSLKEKEMADYKQKYEADMKTVIEREVNKRLNQRLQSVGVTNFLLEIPVEIKSPKEVYERFLAMPNGSAKQEFFQKNEAEIRKGMAGL